MIRKAQPELLEGEDASHTHHSESADGYFVEDYIIRYGARLQRVPEPGFLKNDASMHCSPASETANAFNVDAKVIVSVSTPADYHLNSLLGLSTDSAIIGTFV